MWSLYHQRRMTFDRAARWLVSVQHYSFYPIMAVARFNLYAQTLILLATSKAGGRGGGNSHASPRSF